MNETFLEALITWQSEGRRMISIKIDALFVPTKTTIHCYDYDNGISFFPVSAEDIPTDVAAFRIEQLKKEQEYISARLKELEGENAA